MKTRLIALALCVAAAPALFAVEGSVLKRDGNAIQFKSVEAETLSGIEWKDPQKNPGSRIDVWDVDQVRYTAKGMDQFNGLAKKLLSGRGDALEKDANDYVTPPKELTDEGDKLRVELTARYYVARAKLLQGAYLEAADMFLAYMKKCEDAVTKGKPGSANYPQFMVKDVVFASPTGNKILQAGALHRLYLDALEGLGDAYARADDSENASAKGYDNLVKLTGDLNAKSSKVEYFDWALRALKAAGDLAEAAKDGTGITRARESFEKLAVVALKRASGKPSRASMEASLKVGFLLVQEKKYNDAQSRFQGPIREWENGQKAGKSGITANWLNSDVAYLASGSYVGMGMVRAAQAKDAETYTVALVQFATALAIFSTAPEIRALGLLGAAECSGQLAKLSKDAGAASRHAENAERYLFELRTTLGQTKPATDKKVAEITAMVDKYKQK